MHASHTPFTWVLPHRGHVLNACAKPYSQPRGQLSQPQSESRACTMHAHRRHGYVMRGPRSDPEPEPQSEPEPLSESVTVEECDMFA